jgi:hypothetical protein
MKYIPEFNNRYLITENGEVFCTKNNRYINPHLSGVKRRNYYQITLYHEGKKFTKRVHSWMAITYLDFKYGDRTIVVDHIDNNHLNNHLSNLQIISNKENCTKDRVKKTNN